MSEVGGRKSGASELPALEWMPSERTAGQSDAAVEVRRTGPRGAVVVLAMVVVSLLGTVTLRGGGDKTASPPVGSEPIAQPGSSATVVGDGGTPSLAPVAAQGRRRDLQLAELGVEFRAVVTSVDGRQMALLGVSADGTARWSPLPRLRSVRFDRSGRWIAGTTSTEYRDGQVLWVGDAESAEFQPVALDVRSFAWHDQQAASLAWNTTATPTVLSTLALGKDTTPTDMHVPAVGAITAWGRWGFAVLTSGVRFRSALLADDGTPIAVDLPGRFVAALPDGVLFAGSDGPRLVDPTDGAARPVAWIDGAPHVWALTEMGDGSLAALIDHGGIGAPAFSADLVVVRPGQPPHTVFKANSYSDLATVDGGALLFVEQQSSGRSTSGSIHVYRGGDHRAVELPDLFDGGEWVAAISAVG